MSNASSSCQADLAKIRNAAQTTRRATKRKSARQSILVNDGRVLCRGKRADGGACTYRACRDGGFCQRHDPQKKQDPAASERARLAILNKIREDPEAVITLAKMGLIPDSQQLCPKCDKGRLFYEGKKHVNIHYYLCNYRSCFARTSAADVLRLVNKVPLPGHEERKRRRASKAREDRIEALMTASVCSNSSPIMVMDDDDVKVEKEDFRAKSVDMFAEFLGEEGGDDDPGVKIHVARIRSPSPVPGKIKNDPYRSPSPMPPGRRP